MDLPLDKKRNVAVIAHSGAGKTSLAEAMLFGAGASVQLGRVDDGTSILDHEPEERARRMTISSAIHRFEWAGCAVNLIDTPGYSDFLPETREALHVVGGAVVMLSAISGVKVQTEKIWGYADEFEVCRIAFVNKMDRERAQFLRAVDDMEKALGVRGLPVQVPIGEGAAFQGIIDLITMKAYFYKDDASGRFDIKDIPAAHAAEAARHREELVAAAAEADDGLTEKYLNTGGLSGDEIRKALREAVLTRRFVPVMLGSASKNIGVNLLMDAVTGLLPSPLDKGVIRGVIRGQDPATGTPTTREHDPASPFSAFIFKTIIDPYTGKLSVFRVWSGAVHADSTVYNPGRGVKEKVTRLYVMEGARFREVKGASAGDIAAAAKLKDALTGDTLCDPAHPIAFAPLPAPAAALSYAIRPLTKADEDKAGEALGRLMEEDPSLVYRRDEATKEFIISGAGQVHLEVSVERLRRKYGCGVELKTPAIPYMETIRSRARAQGRYRKQSGGRGQYGDVWLDVRPLPRGNGFEFADEITGGVIPRQYIPAVEKGVREAMRSGALAGYPVADVRVAVYDGSFHSVDSSEMSFKIAASMAFKKGMGEAHPVLLEPVMRLEINVPDDKLGDCLGDLNARRGKILGTEPSSGGQTISCLAPMSGIITYAVDLNAMTGGRGIFTMEFAHYDEVPAYLAQKIIVGAKGKDED
ncbi:MAG: elongation factor G [Deltaproteobacteria bacterium]|nr:elongation factor G [Deltaproteobacteria bacterium]